MARALVLLLALVGCRAAPDGKDPVDTDTMADAVDEDLDGYTPDEGDCDDGDAAVNPGATERCNTLDDNCDGTVDEDVLLTFYADADDDGYGDPASTTLACEAPAGAVETGTDCDDHEPARFPGNPEVCDALDNDCDDTVDEGVATMFYADVDADGYGDPGTAFEACELPEGAVALTGDCDDSTAAAFPGNAESCDEIDNNCDGTVDEGVTTTWYVDLDGDAFGDDALTQEACDQPTGYAPSADDCDDTAATVFPGAVEACNEVDDNCDGAVDEGVTSVFYADTDGDGHGNAESTIASCTLPSGYSGASDDCDDTTAAVSPDAAERCNEVDDDCDGTVDEADAIDAPTWYIDFDGDGYGSDRSTSVACDAPDAYVGNDDDCDDTRAAVHTVSEEVCNGFDDDCDGETDEDDASDRGVWFLDADGDGYGDASDSLEECDAPTGYVADDTDCDDADDTIHPDAVEGCDATDEDCDGLVDDDDVCPCDVDYYGDSTYLFCTTASTWSAAEESCEAVGYHLVTVNDLAEDDWLLSVAATYGSISAAYWWTGLNDLASEGSWVWVDGSPVTFTRWNGGEPNNSGNEDCTQLTWASAHWNDWPCDLASTYVCEAE